MKGLATESVENLLSNMIAPPRHSPRFGLLCDGTRIAEWQAQCVRELVARADAAPAVIIGSGGSDGPNGRGDRGHRAISGGMLFQAYWKRIVEPRVLRTIELGDELDGIDVLRIPLRPTPESGWDCAPGDIARVEAMGLDFILNFRDGPVPDHLLPAARYGVWSFRFGASTEQSEPPAFRDFCDGREAAFAVLETFAEPPVLPQVLRWGAFRIMKHSYLETLASMLTGCAHWPAAAYANLGEGRLDGSDPPTGPFQDRPTGAPGNWETVCLAARAARGIAGKAYLGLLRHEIWNVGIVDAPIESFLTRARDLRIDWLDERAGKFLADPFPVEWDGRRYVVCEEFDYRTSRGRLVCLDISDGTPRNREELALDLPGHVSYPFLFRDHGRLYCIPESAAANEIALFEAEDFPGEWRKVATLVANFAGVDSSLVRHDGRWWLLATNDREGKQDRLWVWHASDLIGPWEPHAANPVKTDVRSARPGGTPFFFEGRLYRPAQDSSRAYGGSIVINRVEELTPTRFHETATVSIAPDPAGRYPAGCHTLSGAGPVTVLDGKRHAFVPASSRAFVKRGFRLLAGRARTPSA